MEYGLALFQLGKHTNSQHRIPIKKHVQRVSVAVRECDCRSYYKSAVIQLALVNSKAMHTLLLKQSI
ncbi:hypothetical protein NC653_009852 [Populus alba x Populus x berolinensis]|uniref:Uncharacterized protein n=1 Tax=Populus alba x Populus x berolinensis TaxID=444605 RepID=A0AAD6RAJ6_9ROSI|nr:hypothetical protein NC653_009852 [Populus alba x Populus x berolinensis]